MPHQKASSLSQARSELIRAFSPADHEAYRHLIDWLRETDVASHALQVGDTAPDFLLPDADGRLHSSEQLRGHGPLVVSFFRGGWCPFCVAQLSAFQATKARFDELRANVVLLSPETRHLPRQLKRELGLTLTILSDVDHGVAMSYGVLFRVPDQIKAYYSALGVDLASRHGASEWMLPIASTFTIDQFGTITGAFVELDHTIRQEPMEILANVCALAGRSYPSSSDR